VILETDFIVGQDNFADLIINPTAQGAFYFFFNQRDNRLVKRFVLDCSHPNVHYLCEVTLIKKNEKFTPRLNFNIKDETGRLRTERLSKDEDSIELKASVNLANCHENLWSLISFLRTLREIEVPDRAFSLVAEDESVIVAGIRDQRDVESVKRIVGELLEGVSLSVGEVNVLLKRKERLASFETSLKGNHKEAKWQEFFENNKWIFGYGLNYVILKEQPHAGGMRFDRKAGQNPDFLGITSGNVKFTALVEIKTPQTPLLAGEEEIRNGAWSLSKDLTDALAQLQANTDRWIDSSKSEENKDALEKQGIYTVRPKAILVIGNLLEVKEDPRSRRQTFERFRRSIHGIEIITFDELSERAKFIVDHTD
jgi:hypothetical protein